MTARVKKTAYDSHFAESRFNGKKGKVIQVDRFGKEICIKFKDGESAWFYREDLK